MQGHRSFRPVLVQPLHLARSVLHAHFPDGPLVVLGASRPTHLDSVVILLTVIRQRCDTRSGARAYVHRADLPTVTPTSKSWPKCLHICNTYPGQVGPGTLSSIFVFETSDGLRRNSASIFRAARVRLVRTTVSVAAINACPRLVFPAYRDELRVSPLVLHDGIEAEQFPRPD